MAEIKQEQPENIEEIEDIKPEIQNIPISIPPKQYTIEDYFDCIIQLENSLKAKQIKKKKSVRKNGKRIRYKQSSDEESKDDKSSRRKIKKNNKLKTNKGVNSSRSSKSNKSLKPTKDTNDNKLKITHYLQTKEENESDNTECTSDTEIKTNRNTVMINKKKTKGLFSFKKSYTQKSKLFKKKSKRRVFENRIKCDHCEKVCRNEDHYNRHVKFHKGETFSCNICLRVFLRNCDLINHTIVHNFKPINCEICRKRFDNFYKFLNHQKTHKEQ